MMRGRFSQGVRGVASAHFKVGLASIGVAAFAISFVTMFIVANSVTRYGFNYGLPGMFEIAGSGAVLFVWLSMAHTQARGQNLRLTFVLSRFPRKGQYILDILALLAGTGLCGLMAWQGYFAALESLQRWDLIIGSLGVAYFPSKLGFALGATFVAIEFLIELTKRIIEGDAKG